eukprot:Hpha_TRINITY_DN33730_c0_g1::TRINITY_DN33730_c0_g1_i1::g.25014::m.25014
MRLCPSRCQEYAMWRLAAPLNWVLELMLLKDIDETRRIPVRRFPRELLDTIGEDCEETALRVLSGDPNFERLATSEARDLEEVEDAEIGELKSAVEDAVQRGLLRPMKAPPAARVNVRGRTPDEVAKHLLDLVGGRSDPAVVVIQGMPGVGKDAVARELQKQLPRCAIISCADMFKMLTFAVERHCESAGLDLRRDEELLLSPERAAEWVRMLRLDGSPPEASELRLKGQGLNASAAELRSGPLQQPSVTGNTVFVSRRTQAHAIPFVAAAVSRLRAQGCSAVVVGLGPTLAYVGTPHRFELVLDFGRQLGERSAARRVLSHTAQVVASGPERDAADDVAPDLLRSAAILARAVFPPPCHLDI